MVLYCFSAHLCFESNLLKWSKHKLSSIISNTGRNPAYLIKSKFPEPPHIFKYYLQITTLHKQRERTQWICCFFAQIWCKYRPQNGCILSPSPTPWGVIPEPSKSRFWTKAQTSLLVKSTQTNQGEGKKISALSFLTFLKCYYDKYAKDFPSSYEKKNCSYIFLKKIYNVEMSFIALYFSRTAIQKVS